MSALDHLAYQILVSDTQQDPPPNATGIFWRRPLEAQIEARVGIEPA
jgi:hypothetical protein